MLDSAMLMRNAATAMMDATAAMMDVGAKADRTKMARRQTVTKEHDAAAMGAGIPHVEEITSMTHRDHRHHLLCLAKVEAEALEVEDFLKVLGRERTTTKLVLANPRLRKIPRHNLNTPPWLRHNLRSSTTKIATSVLSASVLGSVQWSTP